MSDFATFENIGSKNITIVLHHTDPSTADIEYFFRTLAEIYNSEEQERPFVLSYDVRDCDVIFSGLGSLALFSRTLRDFEQVYEDHIREHTEHIHVVVSSDFIQKIASGLVSSNLVPVSFVKA
jgi:hypothetical protein